jgi:uncharacterized membrane protein YdjX (TVP38/TMEM64 family)
VTRSEHPHRRAVVIAILIALAVAVTVSDFTHEKIQNVLDFSRAVMINHPRFGKTLFVALSALSAMAAFFSSAVVVPVAVYAWGDRTTFILLWIAWLIGGCCSYAVGRTLGRGVFTWLVDPKRFEYYADRISRDANFLTVLLFQLALPSEIPGYVLGAVRFRFRTYLWILAIAELPFALGAVYLGDAFVHRQNLLFVVVALAGLFVTVIALRRLQHEMARGR